MFAVGCGEESTFAAFGWLASQPVDFREARPLCST
jgi:hypothetical protein